MRIQQGSQSFISCALSLDPYINRLSEMCFDGNLISLLS